MRVHIFCLNGEERPNQELQNAFLDESPTQKEAKIHPFKLSGLFAIFAQNVARNTTFRAKAARKPRTHGCDKNILDHFAVL